MQQDTFSTDDLEPPSQGARAKLNKTHATLIHIRTVPQSSKFPSNPRASAFREKFYPDSTVAQWNDWRWQLRNRITDAKTLNQMLILSRDEYEAIGDSSKQIPMAITPLLCKPAGQRKAGTAA